MSKPFLWLRSGSKVLDLNDQARFWLAQDFVPPATAYTSQFSEGLMSNRRLGGSLVMKRATNRGLTFTVRLAGSSAGEIQRAQRDIQAMLNQAGDTSAPLYLEYSANADLVEPLWGQFGSHLHYEVVDGTCVLGDGYLVGVRRNEDVNLSLSLTLKPYALGSQQRLATASGGILEDSIGAPDGRSKGLIVPEATTNLFTNPVFGNATWNTGWTAAANVLSERNTDAAFLIPGTISSAKLVAISTTAIAYTQAITLTVATYAMSCYAKSIDGTVISATQIALYYQAIGALSTTYTSVGDGWYRLSATFTGAASAQNIGVVLGKNYTLFVTGFQVELKGYATALACGDWLGCAWTGTAHASTSTRAAGVCKIPTDGLFNYGSGTFRVVFRANQASTALGAFILMQASGAVFKIGYDAGDTYTISDATNSASSAAYAFAINDTVVLHFVYGPGGLVLYRNGVSIASNATYTPPAAIGTYLDVGQAAAALHSNVTLMAFSYFDVALTAGQALADYTDLAPLVTDGLRAEAVPWLWTKDGDNVVDNYDDATHDMHSVIGGIAGSAPALNEMNLTTDENAASFYVFQSLYPSDAVIDASDFFGDDGGTVDAAALGGAASVANVSTGSVYNLGTSLLWKNFNGGPITLLIRAKDAGSNLRLKAYYFIATGIVFEETLEASKVGSGYGLQLLKSVVIPVLPEGGGVTFSITASRSTGSGNYSLDYDAVLPGKVLLLKSESNNYNTFWYESDRDNVYLLNSGYVSEMHGVLGDHIEFVPEKFNYLFSHVGASATSVLTRTVTYNWIKVTPRWSLL
jgi:hypothetical protein